MTLLQRFDNDGWSVKHLFISDTMIKAEEQKVETTKINLKKSSKSISGHCV